VVQVVRANGTKVSMLRSIHADGRALPNALYASPLTLLPGDRLVTTCIYNTSRDKGPGVGHGQKQRDVPRYTLLLSRKVCGRVHEPSR
jgi:hypothetical protein